MNHPDVEMLTQFALDDPLALDAATLVHISDCEQCTHEIDQIQRVVDATLVIGGRSDLRTLTSPPPSVWEQIVAELDGDAGPDWNEAAAAAVGLHRGEPVEQDWLFGPDSEVGAPVPVTTSSVEPPSRPSTGWRLLAAAVVGLVLGAGVTWVVAGGSGDDGGSTVGTARSSTLAGIDGHTATGELTLEDTTDGPRLTVDFDAGDTGKGFVQVWLLDADTGGMVSLGVLDGTSGTFAVPSQLDLSTYNQVDVSLEPFDGDPQHSADSLARGPVPTT